MALVTVVRSPSSSNSISSSSDSGGIREEENQRTSKSLNECYFAGKGTALMLGGMGSNERLQRQMHYSAEGRRFSQISNELSASQTSIGSVGSDIQQHLQSMFYLLRPEETLKMAVKLESLRAGRTRYLVVVSRPASKKAQQLNNRLCVSPDYNSSNNNQAPTTTTSNTNELMTENIASSSHLTNESSIEQQTSKRVKDDNVNIISTSFQSSGGIVHSSVNMITTAASCDNDSNCNFASSTSQQQICNTADDHKCDNESTVGSSCSSKSSSNEIEESCLLGIDCNEKTTVGLVLRVLADTAIRLDGDGGFSVSVCGRQHIFKPVSVQAMWSALQTLYKISSKAQEHNFFPGGPSHEWVQYYENRIESDRSCLNEWHAMDSLESRRPPSPDTIRTLRTKPTQREETERVIRNALKEIMMSVDLDEVTSKYIRGRLEEHLDMDLNEYKSFIDEEMLVILGQMDAPTEIFDHVYLGSEWNASNLEELQRNGVGHILNVTREIDNFFPGMFDYFNVRVYDDDKTDLLKHWDNTFKYIQRAKLEGSKVLVHCKMGISRSASVVIAYAMKQYNWEFSQAIQHVKEKRSCIKPNKNFLAQLETYQGILDAMKNKEKLQRSKSETNLKSENSKDGKSLPGSEPTPLIQAMQRDKNSTYPSSKKEALYLKRINQRPSSSPDISKSTSETLSNVKPLSFSLETLVTTSDVQTEATNASETTNLRWPCNNGHYSVSQNQIIYLENESLVQDNNNLITVPLVRSIISELEQHHEKMKKREERGDEISMPTKKEPDIGKQQVYSCSAEIIHQDSFDSSMKVILRTASAVKKENDTFSKQVDRVFDREEKRQSKIEPTLKEAVPSHCNFVSRQSSWSSVDSACIVGDLPSRNSSWGSGDNRPSRNSSWGSYDTNTTKAVIPTTLSEDVVMGQSGIFPYEKDEIPWHPGTVKRTKQKIEEKQISPSIMRSTSGPSPLHHHHQIDAKNNNNNKILCDIKKSLLIDNLTYRTNQQQQQQHKGSSISPQQQPHKFAKLRQSSSVSSAAINSSKQHTRCKSEEYLTAQRALLTAAHNNKISNDRNNNKSQPLSASAPETFCLSFSIDPNSETSSLEECDEIAAVKLRRSESDTKKANKKENQSIGKVKNLKMNFEAKAINNISNVLASSTNTTASKNRKNHCQSLPSSPIAIHIDVSSTTGFPGSDFSSEEKDKTVRERVESFEYGRTNSIFNSSNLRQRPKSLYESKFQAKGFTQHQQRPYQISHKTILTKGDGERRPPIPFQSNCNPTVRNALMTSNQNNVVSSHHRKQQQGKTHPLTKLNLTNKQKINTSPTTATAYNTM